MSDNISLICRCPKGHGPVLSYQRTELEKGLKDGTLKFFCASCGNFFYPTELQKENIRHRLDEP